MTTQQDQIEADFIVIGAGSAGCAAAARLSEDPATRVLLLEAGGEDRNRWIHIPLGFGKTFADPSVNWCYETEPDPGAGDRQVRSISSSRRQVRKSGGTTPSTAKLPDDSPPRRSVNATELLSQLPLCQSGARLPDQLS